MFRFFRPLPGLLAALSLSACAPLHERIQAIGPDGVQYVQLAPQPTPPANINQYVAGLGQQIKGPELYRLLSGNTAYGRMNQRQGSWAEYTSHDGRAIFRNRAGELSDGQWWVTGDQACFRYQGSDAAYCNFAVIIDGRVQYVLTNGRMDYYVLTRAAGDSEGLSEALLRRNGR